MRTMILAAALLASGCTVTTTQPMPQMSDPEILASLSDKQLCWGSEQYPLDMGLLEEMQRRNLPCHPFFEGCADAPDLVECFVANGRAYAREQKAAIE